MEHYEPIHDLIARVRRRWRAVHGFRAATRASLTLAGLVALALIAAYWTGRAPLALVAIAMVTVVLSLIGLLWSLSPLRDLPSDRQVARFIEEREPTLEDRLVSAVEVAIQTATSPEAGPGLSGPLVADAARRTLAIEVDRVLPREAIRRASVQALLAVLLVAVVLFNARHAVRQAYDAVGLTFFPARVALEVRPGNARIRAGSTVAIEARLVGNRAPVVAALQLADMTQSAESAAGDPRHDDGTPDLKDVKEMKVIQPGEFRLSMDAVSKSFRYRVVAGAITSPVYEIAVAHPPRVARVDVDYTYPSGLGLQPRTEQDSGDIYAPAGTSVRVHVTTDRPAATGTLALASGRTVELTSPQPTEFTTTFKVEEDDSYRIALADREGFSNAGETEYFIRLLEDRPPEVRILKPATDRAVTPLEEVDIEAQAEDDYAIDRLDLAYAVRGGPEHVVPFQIPRRSATVIGRQTLFLEDLNVQPGDFVSYYVRARDLTRGTRPNEARSDIFFLEVKPYEQEFALAQSQSSAGAGGGRGSIDDLVAAEKEIIVATWKLDRRADAAKGAKPEADIRTVSRAQAELKSRVEQASSAFRESTMRNPRKRPGRGGRGADPPSTELKAGQTLPEEDEMVAAAEAMAKAVTSLDALKTADARAPEMEALNHLLKAQADVKKREVMRQQAGSGAGNNRSNYDLSTLFDKELQKQQQTNYETKSSAEQKDDPNQGALDKVRELARRQDELLKRQQDLARNREKMSEEELRRELEKLARDQSELRQRAEDLARQMANQQRSAASRQQQQSEGAGQKGPQSASSEPSQGPNGKPGGGQSSQQMREVSEAMRSATNDLRRQDPKQATTSLNRALDKLREVERDMQSVQPDEQRRALGEAQLEARQLADAERQVASALGKSPAGNTGSDGIRRLAGDQQRLAERARALEQSLKQQAAKPAAAGASQTAAGEAAKDLQGQRLSERMQQSADAMRAAVDRSAAPQRGSTPGSPSDVAKGQIGPQQEMARAFDRLADRLAASLGAKDGESRRLSDQIARAQQLRDRIESLGSQLNQLGQPTARDGRSQAKTRGESGRAGQGQQGGGGGSGTDLARLRDEYQRALQETRDLMDQLRREDPGAQTFAHGGAGFTFEGQGMTLSAPGTEAFKQDFARWEDLRRQVTQALDRVETSLSKKLQAQQAKERLAAGADDKVPSEYQQQVGEYFKAIAKKKGS